jgi:hypothetical protein
MPKHKNKKAIETPISVRVARWAALAAAITAFGSIVTTVWSDRPWWVEPTPVVQTVSAPVVPSVQVLPNQPKHVEMFSKSQPNILYDIGPITAGAANSPVTSPRLEVTKFEWYRDTMKFLWRHPMASLLIVGCLVVFSTFGVMEFLYHRRTRSA